MASFTMRPLDATTWREFAALVERHNGVWGGCWCMAFHAEGGGHEGARQHRAAKEARVRSGNAHAALVFDRDMCVGWCQFGPPAELPRIKARRAYEAENGVAPDWRITCFFVDKSYRKQGVAAAALAGALSEIGRLGGGTVESFPEDAEGRSVSSSFLHNGTLAMFERAGFARQRRLGKDRWAGDDLRSGGLVDIEVVELSGVYNLATMRDEFARESLVFRTPRVQGRTPIDGPILAVTRSISRSTDGFGAYP